MPRDATGLAGPRVEANRLVERRTHALLGRRSGQEADECERGEQTDPAHIRVIRRVTQAAPVEARTHSADELDRLYAAVGVADDVRDLADELIDRFVAAARDAGRSWSEIGAVLGVTKQAAQQRFVPPDRNAWPKDFDAHARQRIDYIGVTFRTRTIEEVREILIKMRADLWDDVKAGRIKVPIDRTYPLAEAKAGHEHMRTNQHFGKILLIP